MARLKGAAIRVEGLDELRRELRKLDDAGLTNALRQANYDVAEHVIARAKAAASTKLQRKAADSMTASRQAARAQINAGGSKAPFFGGAEFGAGQGQRRVGPSGRQFLGHNQFEAWRGNGMDAGYFLYPTIRDETDEIIDIYGDEIERISRKAFPD